MDLSKKRTRERLKSRREPYWQKVGPGAYLGFRAGADSWIGRYRDRRGKQHYNSLDLPPDGDYDAAFKAAVGWFAQMGTAVRAPKRGTVQEALESYLADLERHGRTAAAKTATGLFKTAIYDAPLAALPLEDATRDDFEEWRDKLAKGRAPQSVNRYVRQISAALTKATQLGHTGNRDAWQLSPLEEGDHESAVFLTPGQRVALISAASPSAARFFRALELTGCRPGELAAITVKDYDAVEGTVRFASRKGKSSKLRVRFTVLDKIGRDFFNEQARDKLPKAPLFTDGPNLWRRERWAEEFRAAADAVNEEAKKRREPRAITEDASSYAFRHARISELLQVHGIDPLTTAAQVGTGLAMIEKNYLRFIPHAFKDKLAGLRAAT